MPFFAKVLKKLSNILLYNQTLMLVSHADCWSGNNNLSMLVIVLV